MARLGTRAAVLAAVVGLGVPAAAGAAPGAEPQAAGTARPAPRVEYEKKTVINFDDDTIQGDLTRPDGEYVESRKKVDHSSLIRIRESWREKVKQAGSEL
ncbi:adventurous gliding motility protein CglF [Anaeromyxobacter paludicola]|uniref:Uncharacterized protein n=1 Tax=Anaeromyxobacter paludicola TaxID=2918171 RepID=A0ABN6N994_9BACT|nr:adventurous gliding motility protein CglF [Anaeromyxobacter paludicola]BDG08684.1 hypothetical protein AMPC_17970 [Anaeromyxobacter paludicola]